MGGLGEQKFLWPVYLLACEEGAVSGSPVSDLGGELGDRVGTNRARGKKKMKYLIVRGEPVVLYGITIPDELGVEIGNEEYLKLKEARAKFEEAQMILRQLYDRQEKAIYGDKS